MGKDRGGGTVLCCFYVILCCFMLFYADLWSSQIYAVLSCLMVFHAHQIYSVLSSYDLLHCKRSWSCMLKIYVHSDEHTYWIGRYILSTYPPKWTRGREGGAVLCCFYSVLCCFMLFCAILWSFMLKFMQFLAVLSNLFHFKLLWLKLHITASPALGNQQRGIPNVIKSRCLVASEPIKHRLQNRNWSCRKKW